jgi:diguanylate cyclase (GGDEF)-like protein
MVLSSRNRRELARWAQDAALLADLTRALAGSRDPTEARAAVCEGARRVADASVAALVETVSDGAVLVPLAVAGADLHGLELSIGDPALGAGRAIREARPALTVASAAAGGDREFLHRAGALSAVWHPVGRPEARPAVLAVAWREQVEHVPARVTSLLALLAAEAEFALGRADDLIRLRRMVLTDQLTGLPNRRALEEHLPRELARARREGFPLSLAMLDLDHFKDYNDERGHLAGDRLLERAAAAWLQVLRPYDTLARFGGEEFMIIVPGCDLDAAASIVERLRSVTPGGESCSAGVVEWTPSEHPEVLVARADGALYEAKRAGRNRTVATSAAY